jgi:protein involved in polysaccharide export with SLBB domain
MIPRLGRFPARCLLLLSLALAAGPLAAQEGQVVGTFDPGSRLVTRAELERLLEDTRSIAASPAYSEEVRGQAEAYIRLLEQRLVRGDFRAGDRIILSIDAQTQAADTFTVEPGPLVVLGDLGPISLDGVLRSELEEHMQEQVTRFVRSPQVAARTLIRVNIMGNVGQQGSYYLPSNMLLDDALMVAGGPRGRVNLEEIEIRRGSSRVIWRGSPLESARMEGMTLDQLALQSGDQIDVPEDQTLSRSWWAQTLVRGALAALTIYVLGVRIF